MKEEKINCTICCFPVAIIQLCNDSLEFDKDVKIKILNGLVCEDCLKNKNIITNVSNIWDEGDNKL